jgi:predicted nucleic acid-binding protein
MRGCLLHAPAHLDAEVLSAFGRIHRAAELPASTIATTLEELGGAPIRRHPPAPLLAGAWERRDELRLDDALYVELAVELDQPALLSTDRRLARTSPLVELIATST